MNIKSFTLTHYGKIGAALTLIAFATVLVVVVVQNAQLRIQVRALEATQSISLVNSVKLDPLEMKRMMQEVLGKAKPTALHSDLQVRCGRRAEEVFSAAGLKTAGSSYQSHYNADMDKCFIKTSSMLTDERRKVWQMTEIYDAYENKEYGSIYKHPNSDSIEYCMLFPKGNRDNAIKCTEWSFGFFERLHMEN